jgi:hypothetical protein
VNIIEQLVKLQAELDAKDPLLQKGIGKDWVCVIPPSLEYALSNKAIELYGDTNLTRLNWATMLLGRPTYVQPTAPLKIEYMSPEEYKERYGNLYHESE